MESLCLSERLATARICACLALFCALLTASGCLSPLDPDTPRRRIVSGDAPQDTGSEVKWLPAVMSVTASESRMPWPHNADVSYAEVDTSGGRAVVRFRYRGVNLPPYNPLWKFLLSFTIADSIAADGADVSMYADPRFGRGALFEMAKAVDSTTATPLETIIIRDPSQGGASITLLREAERRSIAGVFTATISTYRISLVADIRITW